MVDDKISWYFQLQWWRQLENDVWMLYKFIYTHNFVIHAIQDYNLIFAELIVKKTGYSMYPTTLKKYLFL